MSAQCLSALGPDCGNEKLPGTNVCAYCQNHWDNYVATTEKQAVDTSVRILKSRGWTCTPPKGDTDASKA